MLTQSSPVHYTDFNDFETEETKLHKSAQCIRIVLEAGADLSLEQDMGNIIVNGFVDAVFSWSFVSTSIHSQR